jgi:hypothetical protein
MRQLLAILGVVLNLGLLPLASCGQAQQLGTEGRRLP